MAKLWRAPRASMTALPSAPAISWGCLLSRDGEEERLAMPQIGDEIDRRDGHFGPGVFPSCLEQPNRRAIARRLAVSSGPRFDQFGRRLWLTPFVPEVPNILAID